MLLKKNYLKYNIIINKIKQTLINKDKKNNIYKNKYLIKYRYKICLNYNPKLLLNIIKNKIYFYILNYFNKNMLYIPYIKNFKKIYNIKTM